MLETRHLWHAMLNKAELIFPSLMMLTVALGSGFQLCDAIHHRGQWYCEVRSRFELHSSFSVYFPSHGWKKFPSRRKFFISWSYNWSNFFFVCPGLFVGRVAQSVWQLATGLTVRGSNPGGDEIFRTCPDRSWGSPSLLYSWYRVFPGGKERPGLDSDPSHPSSAVGHVRVELYLYSAYGPYRPYRASVPVQGWPLPYFIFHRFI